MLTVAPSVYFLCLFSVDICVPLELSCFDCVLGCLIVKLTQQDVYVKDRSELLSAKNQGFFLTSVT
jgi:hypothetical protein